MESILLIIESFDSDESTILFFVSVAAFLALTVEAIRVSKAGCKISRKDVLPCPIQKKYREVFCLPVFHFPFSNP